LIPVRSTLHSNVTTIAVYDQAITNNQIPVLSKGKYPEPTGNRAGKSPAKCCPAPTQYKEEINRLATEEPAVNKRAGRIELIALLWSYTQASNDTQDEKGTPRESERALGHMPRQPPSTAIIAQIARLMAPVVTRLIASNGSDLSAIAPLCQKTNKRF